jgi:DnaJ family protein A protein 2
MSEPADLEDVDNTTAGFGGAMDEDEEHEHAGGERVQCASQ